MRARFKERSSQLIKVTLHQLFPHGLLSRGAACSITEVEVVVGVVVVLTLSDHGADGVDGEGQPCESEPDLYTEVNDETLDEELVGTAVQEVEQPLLSGVRSVMPDVAAHVTFLCVEVVLTIPCLVHHLRHTETLAVNESHVLGVSKLVVCQSSS